MFSNFQVALFSVLSGLSPPAQKILMGGKVFALAVKSRSSSPRAPLFFGDFRRTVRNVQISKILCSLFLC